MVGDEDLPLALGQLAAAGARHAVGAEVAPLAGLAEHVGASVGGVGEHVVHRVVGRLHPGDLLAAQVAGRLQREAQALLAQPQPHPAHRPGHREPVEDRGDDAGDGLVRVPADLPVGLTPHQPDRQPAAQLAAGGLVADPAVEAGAQDVQLGLGHGALHAQQQAVVEQPGVVDAVGVGDQRVGHPGQVQQPVPVGVVAGQPGALQRQHDPHLPEPDLGGQLGEPRAAGRAGPADAQVVVDHPHGAAWPAQPLGPRDQVVLAGGGLPVAVDLRQRGLADIDHRRPPQMRGGHLELTHQRSPPSRSARRPWRSRRPAARSPPRPPRSATPWPAPPAGAAPDGAGAGSGIRLSWTGCMEVLLGR